MMQNKLKDEVAAKYTCTIVPAKVITRYPDRQEIDLRKIGVKKADELVAKGFPYLKAKPSVKSDKDKDTKE